MNTHEWPCRIKSARRKRRLVKTDRDKQLIQLYKRRKELWEQQAQLPWVVLEEPYQRGWKRFFVLREDIKHSPRAEFYEALLAKINTTEYHHDKSFKQRKRRKGRYGYVVTKQMLRELDLYDWNSAKLDLSEQEKACFTRVETFSIKTRRLEIKYVITESWRYVLKVAPHMITHKRLKDSDIEKELGRIDNHTNNYDLPPRIELLTHGKGYNWNGWYSKSTKYINKFKNIPRYANKEAYLELET
ncbi:MAG: hypothetical protein JWR38_911 [Mucilaginibacter sp.]|nr:hypothetical protein [Mucilaginibacter sp.]